jgi:hypothetical protein
VRTRRGFDAGALGRGLGSCDDGICFCVGLGLKGKKICGQLMLIAWCLERRKGTYVAGLGFDAGDCEDTLFLLDLVAVFPIDILWSG